MPARLIVKSKLRLSEFGVALSEDSDRSSKLKEVVKRMSELDIYLTQAEAAVRDQ